MVMVEPTATGNPSRLAVVVAAFGSAVMLNETVLLYFVSSASPVTVIAAWIGADIASAKAAMRANARGERDIPHGNRPVIPRKSSYTTRSSVVPPAGDGLLQR